MATVSVVITTPDINVISMKWPTIPNGDVGESVFYPRHTDRNVQVFGTFGVGGSIKFEGSNDNSNWVTLTDHNDTTLVFTAAGDKMVQENMLYVRPSVTAGDGTTSLTVVVGARRGR